MNLSLMLFGYRRVCAQKEFAADLLNLCLKAEISYADFRVDESGEISFSCGLRSAKQLIELANGEGVPICVSAARGLPKQLYQRRLRWGLILGSFCASVLLFLSTQFVWSVRITGNETMSANEVYRELTDAGFGIGSYLPRFSASNLENRVLLSSDRLAWISVHMDGTVAVVQVVERHTADEESPAKPANLIALFDGQIEMIELYRGDCVVKIGQAVQKGQLLVSGVYDSEALGARFTRAAGRIWARTEHQFEVRIPLNYVEKCYVDEKIGAITLNFFEKSMKIFKNTGNDSGGCDIIEEENHLDMIGPNPLPFSLSVQSLHYYREEERVRTPEEALELAYAALADLLKGFSADTQLLSKEIKTTLTDSEVILVCTVNCIEDIALQSEFEVVD